MNIYHLHVYQAKRNLELLLSDSGLCQHCWAWRAPNTEENQGAQLHKEFCNTGLWFILIIFSSVPVPSYTYKIQFCPVQYHKAESHIHISPTCNG